ncbi:MAG: outer membrane protein [Xanthobacteraceae bacterium]
MPFRPPCRRCGSGFTGGAQAGYNWQRGRWVLGGEADFSWLGAGSAVRVSPFWVTDPFINYMDMSSRYDWLSTARLRAGVLVTPDLLLYATGGLAITQVVDSATHTYPTFPSTGTWSERRTLYGAALGGGLEYGFAPNWSVKAEYLHAFFNNVNPQWTTPDLVVGLAHQLRP